jgi:ADP-heptose:LPS heptosyltransferase
VERVLDSLPRGGRVAVVRLRSLGDCVLTTPALELLKRYRPDLQVRVVVEDRFREIFGDLAMAPSIGAVRRFDPDLCINFHGGTRSAWMTALSGARWRAGFGHYRMRLAYNVAIPRAQEILGVERKVHTAEHLASAMFYLGVPGQEIPRASLSTLPKGRPGGLPHAGVIHAVAATPGKTWPAERFLAVAAHLERNGIRRCLSGARQTTWLGLSRIGLCAGLRSPRLRTC